MQLVESVNSWWILYVCSRVMNHTMQECDFLNNDVDNEALRTAWQHLYHWHPLSYRLGAHIDSMSAHLCHCCCLPCQRRHLCQCCAPATTFVSYVAQTFVSNMISSTRMYIQHHDTYTTKGHTHTSCHVQFLIDNVMLQVTCTYCNVHIESSSDIPAASMSLNIVYANNVYDSLCCTL